MPILILVGNSSLQAIVLALSPFADLFCGHMAILQSIYIYFSARSEGACYSGAMLIHLTLSRYTTVERQS